MAWFEITSQNTRPAARGKKPAPTSSAVQKTCALGSTVSPTRTPKRERRRPETSTRVSRLATCEKPENSAKKVASPRASA